MEESLIVNPDKFSSNRPRRGPGKGSMCDPCVHGDHHLCKAGCSCICHELFARGGRLTFTQCPPRAASGVSIR